MTPRGTRGEPPAKYERPESRYASRMDPAYPTRDDLRGRIRALFLGTGAKVPARPPPDSPFSTADQYRPPTAPGGVPDSADPAATMATWLHAKNQRCGDRTPDECLRGTDADRQHLQRVLDAIAEGGFT